MKICTLALAALWTALHFPLHVQDCAKDSPVVLHRSDQAHISADRSTTSHDCGMPDDAPELRPHVLVLPPFVNNEAVFNAANRRIMAPHPSVLSFNTSTPLVLMASLPHFEKAPFPR